MKRLALVFSLLVALVSMASARDPSTSSDDVYVHGYTRSNGTYVEPHMRSHPDGNFWNNWSTKGNVNPYTGKEGTKVTPPAGYGGYGGYSLYNYLPTYTSAPTSPAVNSWTSDSSSGNSASPTVDNSSTVGPAARLHSWTWTEDAVHRVDAKYLGVLDGKVLLKEIDGSNVLVPMNRLSDADQDYVLSLRHQAK